MQGSLVRALRTVGLLAAAALLLVAPPGAVPASAQTLEEKVQEITLGNGMRFLVVERHEAPVVFCAVAFDVGAANEGPNITGISHLLEHMMFKGTKMLGTTDYEKEIPYIEKADALGEKTILLRREIGEWRFTRFQDFSRKVIASFSDEEKERLGANRAAQVDLLVEKIRGMGGPPDSLARVPYLITDAGKNYLDLYLEYERAWGEITRLIEEQRRFIVKEELWDAYTKNGSRMLNAFTANDATVYFAYLPSNRLELFMDLESDRMDSPVFREFWTERDVVMEERRLSDNDPDDQLGEAFYAVAFQASPYRWPVLGWMSDLQTISRRDLEEYHRAHYAPNNAVAILTGDVDPAQVRKLAEKYFGSIPRQPDPQQVETREPQQKGERRVVIEHAANPMLMIGYHKPIYPDPDDAALSVLQSILGQGRTSRLYKSVFDEGQLTAEEPRVSEEPGGHYENLIVIGAAPRSPHTLEEVEGAILAEVEKLKTDLVSDRELQRVKNQIDAYNVRNLASNLGIAFQIGFSEIYFGDYRATFRSMERVKAVTAEDVRRVARKYLTRENRTVAYRVQKAAEPTTVGGKLEE